MDREGEKTLVYEIAILALVIWSIFLSFIWYGTGYSDGKKKLQKDAVLQGAAEYVADESGNSAFQWKGK